MMKRHRMLPRSGRCRALGLTGSVLVGLLVFSAAAPVNAHPPRSPHTVAIHGTWTGRSPGPNGEIEVGENFGAGLLNGTFRVRTETFEPVSANGSFILRHEDTISSATHTHVDSTGARVPDTVDTDLTIVVVTDNDEARFTFIGKFSNGTGIFEGAEGYYTGEGTSVHPRRAEPGVSYFAGTIGGELRLARPPR